MTVSILDPLATAFASSGNEQHPRSDDTAPDLSLARCATVITVEFQNAA